MVDKRTFLVIGLGASAGGLEAFEHFFRKLPDDTGMAFVIVTHLARGQVSALPEILGRYTPMGVVTPDADTPLEINTVYVCPPDFIITQDDRTLRLHKRGTDIQTKPIDIYLTSLAEDCRDRAVGVLLSGGGTDGTLGLKAVKEHGGMTIAQGSDGTAPMQSHMPDSAIAAGVVDMVLSSDDMAGWLNQYAANFDRYAGLAADDVDDNELSNTQVDEQKPLYDSIYRLLLNQVGHDFSGYKERTFIRRVRRRMQMLQLEDLATYVQRLRDSPDEVTLLFCDLLIGVTNFFRDPGAFEALEKNIIPKLFEDKGASDQVRVWVPGCATGEEVYSIAILMREHMDTMRAAPRVQIFATDIDEAALNVARGGRYPMALLPNVSPERLRRFFDGDDVSQVVSKVLRDLCVFSSHSVIRDPPFSRIDLISCRNLLIYLAADVQEQLIPIFHFALRPKGYLFLGTSENVTQHADLFAPAEKKHRIFQRRENAGETLQHIAMFPLAGRAELKASQRRGGRHTKAVDLRNAAESRVMEGFAPAHVVVNREGDVLHYSARTGKYLEPAPGLPNRQILAMARRGLRVELRAALREAMETRQPVKRENLGVELEDRVLTIDLTVEPFGDDKEDPLFLVLFDDVAAPRSAQQDEQQQQQNGQDRDKNESRTQQELRDVRERLQVTVEEYETAVEELKASNEELQSINEELQSANEELETSKEELQSVNEELQTVNSELNSKMEEADRTSADLRNIFDSTQIATIFLDSDLTVRGFTPAVTSIFNLIPGDRGRPLTDIVSHLAEELDLKNDIKAVMASGEPIERPVKRADGRDNYLMKVLPYRATNDMVDGAVVTFVEVTGMVHAEDRQRTMVEELNHRVRNMLTVVGAIASQTLSKTPKPDDFAAAFMGRLHSLGQSYSLVSQQQWGQVSLRDMLMVELRAYGSEDEDRVRLTGPVVCFRPPEALALGLIFHELTTNASKYGALSNQEGHVSVTWSVNSALTIDWQETGGPEVVKPKRRGFGTQLIERQLKDSLRAEVKVTFGAEGLRVLIEIPPSAFEVVDG